MTVRITAPAAKMVCSGTQEHRAKLDPKLVPVIVWIEGDTNQQRPVPRLGVGLIEKNLVQNRFVECDEFCCEIAELIPDQVLLEHSSEVIGVEGDVLVFMKV